jgi:hypothetical protein
LYCLLTQAEERRRREAEFRQQIQNSNESDIIFQTNGPFLMEIASKYGSRFKGFTPPENKEILNIQQSQREERRVVIFDLETNRKSTKRR